MSNVLKINRSEIEKELKYSRFLNNFPNINLGSLIITSMCVIAMIIVTFTMLPVGLYNPEMMSDPYNYFSDFNNIYLTLHSHLYCPQIPIAIFAGALLGPRLGTFGMIVYVALGLLGFPFFASGGGIMYVFKPVFGFIIGYILAAYVVGRIFQAKLNSLHIISAAFAGIIIVHFIGITYMVGDLLLTGNSFTTIWSWVYGLSLVNIPYDILFSLILCALARPLRGLLWVAMD